ncbi:hypothetical protein IFM89_012930 [Coptis chinensis]|uniref:Uncharacterized protein n=1 Tax=Coptis chinensis TaxID=261450 RepID=A0A835HB99_9MAGN|nr:hypothetical protein IFM89_012930 [Coptis chinensis]
MKVKQECSKLVKPIYVGDTPKKTQKIPLNVFDSVTEEAHIPLLYAYKPPTPSNAALELGLRKVLSEYRELAGRLDNDDKGRRVILLNDEGARLVEASVSCTLDQAMLLKPSPALLGFHPCVDGVKELTLIQVTRFTCGSLVVGVSTNHVVADGNHASQFFVAWGRACRGLEVNKRPQCGRNIFVPRNPPLFEFEHRGVEFKTGKKDCMVAMPGDLVMKKFHFAIEFLSIIKSKASLSSDTNNHYSTFESLMAYIWRKVVRACESDCYEYARLRIALNGRTRLQPRVPNEYFGNLVLWTYPTAGVTELLTKPLSYSAKLIHEAVKKVNNSYFKSFIDFASYKVDEECLVPKLSFSGNTTCLNLNIDSWLGLPFCDLDFGGGKPHIFTPSYQLWRGQIYVVPSIGGDGSIDVFLALNQKQMDSFKQICYLLD